MAIEQWQSHHPDLIFMDIRMPVLSGYGATQQIRALEAESNHSPKTMILALTASVFEDERAKIIAAGCDDFLRKPITEDQLFRKLTQHLGVSYVYRDRPLTDAEAPSPTTKLRHSTESLAEQPRAWVAQLNLAARGADDDLIWKLLEQITPEQVELAESLAELVNDFRLDKIIKLTETASPEITSPRYEVPPSLMPTLHQVLGLAPDQPTYRILVVDDRSENRQLLVTILQPLGFVISEANNGQVAIERWQTDRPDLIFMDIRMPVLNGYEALAAIQQRLQQDPSLGPAPIVVALTASVAESEKTAIFEAGFDDLIRKPFGETQLLDRLSHHLGVQYLYQD
ncbi:MAG: response regulator, partial [Prochlorothrix sp.]